MKRVQVTKTHAALMPVLRVAIAGGILVLAASATARTVIPINDRDELYANVNDPGNAGALLVLVAGEYKLDPTRAHCGRLELQRDMGLQGAEGASDEVMIDASDLYVTAPCDEPKFPDGSLMKTGAIRMGRGSNSVEWLTVKNASKASAAITTDLYAPGRAYVLVANVVAQASARGIDVRNIGSDLANRQLQVDLIENVLTQSKGNPGQGVRIANINGNGASIRVSMTGNSATLNNVGCLAANLNSKQSSIWIDSANNVFDGNKNGCVFLGGISDNAATAPFDSKNNFIGFSDMGSSFSDNMGSTMGVGGIVAIGGQVASGSGTASQNSVQLQLQTSVLDGNGDIDITATGALAGNGKASQNAVAIGVIGTMSAATICVAQSGSNAVKTTGDLQDAGGACSQP
jgi:hypothetical protein